MLKSRALASVLLIGLTIAATSSARAQVAPANPLATVDENGNGSLVFFGSGPIPMPGILAIDPGPGGRVGALTYNLLGPPNLIAGDVFIYEPGSSVFSDVIRFNPAGAGGAAGYPASLVFYSALDGPIDGIADGPLPTSFYTNTISFFEGPLAGGGTGLIYTPLPGQPGYVAGFNATYLIQSTDVLATPEPASLVLMATGLAGVFARRRKRVTV